MFDSATAYSNDRQFVYALLPFQGLRTALLTVLVVDWLAGFVGPYDLDERMFTNGVSYVTAHDVFHARQGCALVPHSRKIEHRVADPPPGERIHDHKAFVTRWH